MTPLWRLVVLFKPYWRWLALGVFTALLTLLANVTLMATSGWFLSAMALAGAAQVTMNYFTPAALVRGSAMLRTGGRYAERLITHEATLRLLAELRVWFYQHLEPLAPAGLQDYRGGDLLSRIRADIDSLDHFYLRILAPSITALLGGLLMVAFLLFYSPLLALNLGLFLLIAGVVIPWWTQQLADQPGRRKLAIQTEQRIALVDGIQGMAEQQAYGAAQAHQSRLESLNQELAAAQQRLAGIHGLSQGALGLSANLALWVCLWLAIPLLGDGGLAKPELALLALFTLAAFEAVQPLPGAFQALGETRAAAERIFKLIDAPLPIHEPSQAAPMPESFAIRFESVSFTYPQAKQPIIDQFDGIIPAGTRLAIIGPSGCGKSSLIQLLLGFRPLDQGRIRIGGVDIAELSGENRRSLFAVAPQQAQLFTGTLWDNLCLGNPEASIQQVEQACRHAQILDFIQDRPEAYQTWIGEAGLTLSGGQARRIAIARALLKPAPILILDEPTEGLDNVTAQSLIRQIIERPTNQTLIVISHDKAIRDFVEQVITLD